MLLYRAKIYLPNIKTKFNHILSFKNVVNPTYLHPKMCKISHFYILKCENLSFKPLFLYTLHFLPTAFFGRLR